MDSLSTLPHRTWLERASLSLAGVLVFLGSVTLLGWWLHLDELLVPLPSSPPMAPMKANSALGFLVLGGVLLAVEFGRRRLAAFALALLWTLHPLQTESVTYIIQRAESLVGIALMTAGVDNQLAFISGVVLVILSLVLGVCYRHWYSWLLRHLSSSVYGPLIQRRDS